MNAPWIVLIAIVPGERGRASVSYGLVRLFFGSVAEEVLRSAFFSSR